LPDECTATGRVREVVYVGAFTRYIVDLDVGGELVVLQQNLTMSSMEVLEARGRAVRLLWNRQHNRTITETERRPAAAQDEKTQLEGEG